MCGGRPKDYDPGKLLLPLKAIWLAALQPCGERLHAALPDWLLAYEQDHRRLNADERGRVTMDRLLVFSKTLRIHAGLVAPRQ